MEIRRSAACCRSGSTLRVNRDLYHQRLEGDGGGGGGWGGCLLCKKGSTPSPTSLTSCLPPPTDPNPSRSRHLTTPSNPPHATTSCHMTKPAVKPQENALTSSGCAHHLIRLKRRRLRLLASIVSPTSPAYKIRAEVKAQPFQLLSRQTRV